MPDDREMQTSEAMLEDMLALIDVRTRRLLRSGERGLLTARSQLEDVIERAEAAVIAIANPEERCAAISRLYWTCGVGNMLLGRPSVAECNAGQIR